MKHQSESELQFRYKRFCQGLIGILMFQMSALGFAETNSAQATKAAKKQADVSLIYKRQVRTPFAEIYNKLFNALENNGYFIIVEPNIGKDLAHYAQRWGKDYNKNNLQAFRSLIFCNAWYANAISNADPQMTALCPQHITLIQMRDQTHILFIRPSRIAEHSPARDIALELEKEVIRIIDEASGR